MTSGKPVPELPLLVAVLLALSAPARAEVSLDALMAGFAEVSSSQVHFREEKVLEALSSPLVTRGTLTYRAPGYLRKEVIYPARSLFEIRGDELFLETERRRDTVTLDTHPLLRAFAETYRATLAGDRVTLERYFNLDLSGTAERWTLVLLPRDDQVSARIERILLKGMGNSIYAVETTETSGDSTRLTIELDE